MEIPPNEWASIVATVSASSETAESYAAATALHYGFDVKAAGEDTNRERHL